MASTREIGDKAEEIAAGFLTKKGYTILERNWYSGHHEVDVIARHQDIVVFVEVKSRKSNSIQEPYMAVNRNKQQMLISAANAYIRNRNINDEVRFDVISIVLNHNEPVVEHIENAFFPRVR